MPGSTRSLLSLKESCSVQTDSSRIITHFSSPAWSLWRAEWESHYRFIDPVLKSSSMIGGIWGGHACWLTAYKLLLCFTHCNMEAKNINEKIRLFFSPLLLVLSVSLVSYIFSGPLVSYSFTSLILPCVEESSTLSKIKSRLQIKLNCSLFLHKGYFNYINFTEELMRLT